MEKTSEEGKRLHELKMSYMYAARKQIAAQRAWLRSLGENEVPDSEWDYYYEITETKRRPNSKLIGRTLMEARGFAAHLFHPSNGYLQPICTLVLALAVMGVGGSIAREAENREMCARIWAYARADEEGLRRSQVKKVASRIGRLPGKADLEAAAGGFCEEFYR